MEASTGPGFPSGVGREREHALSVIDLERRAVLRARLTAQSSLYREIPGRCSMSTVWDGFCAAVDPLKAGEVL